MADPDSRRDGAGGNAARFFGVGFTFISTVGLLAGGGYLLDRAAGTVPLFLLVGLGLGFAGGLYYVYLALKRM
ncbi:hypothetical protein Rxycam_00727 [Rubrobacter xylanophilus DSM 9941]|uniref:ATP synthase protein I n=1 Tax=Rubrobacter xylanophilus TaxID=49319 RepID=A0A510HGQ8_9ACTN|nr:AtpZ/AtpI family protein [Rubrobacter xylanophilus]QYJ14916.1 hypothetical protein Rxycam_00727 [Rubrobacter xylanophilus DSM 9941]BBL79129.1 hypothetical protein RxyAA322_09830 [Rubrobacter xylanophilus]